MHTGRLKGFRGSGAAEGKGAGSQGAGHKRVAARAASTLACIPPNPAPSLQQAGEQPGGSSSYVIAAAMAAAVSAGGGVGRPVWGGLSPTSRRTPQDQGPLPRFPPTAAPSSPPHAALHAQPRASPPHPRAGGPPLWAEPSWRAGGGVTGRLSGERCSGVLCRAALCCAVLCRAVPCCAVLWRVMPCCAIQGLGRRPRGLRTRPHALTDRGGPALTESAAQPRPPRCSHITPHNNIFLP
jgi:hypothetical protein